GLLFRSLKIQFQINAPGTKAQVFLTYPFQGIFYKRFNNQLVSSDWVTHAEGEIQHTGKVKTAHFAVNSIRFGNGGCCAGKFMVAGTIAPVMISIRFVKKSS